jgi:hypothetical protein
MMLGRTSALVALLVGALLVPTAADASAARLSYRVEGALLTASVTGPIRTGAWRLRFVAPSGDRRTDFVLKTGDIAWSGVIRVARRTAGEWQTTRVIRIDRALAGRQRVQGCTAGICWDTALLRLPRDGDGLFRAKVWLVRSGGYRVAGAVRLAREAFILGPWISSGSVLIRN